jgi:hypothetical protein
MKKYLILIIVLHISPKIYSQVKFGARSGTGIYFDTFYANNNGGQFPITTRSTPGGNFRIYKSGAVNWTMPVANF